MLPLTISILLLLAVVNYRIGGKSLFHPAVAFCSVWAGDLLLVWMVGDFFYPLSAETLFIFMGGGVVFSLGSALAFLYPQGPAEQEKVLSQASNRIINILIVLVVCTAPLAFGWMVRTAARYPGPNFFVSAVRAMLDEELQTSLGYSLFGNTVSLSLLVALIAFRESDSGKKRAFLAILLAFALALLTGARAGITTLTFSLLCLDWLKNRRVRWKLLMTMGLIFLVLMSAVAMLVKIEAEPSASVTANAAPVLRSLMLYAGGGLVAFDRLVREPNTVPFAWHITRGLFQMLNNLGGKFEVQSLHAEFTNIGPHSLNTNVYTFYFAYLEYGYTVMMIIVFILAFLITICYRKAINGGRVAALLYSMLFAYLMVTIFNENFFTNVSFLFKLCLLCAVIYGLPGWHAT